MNGAEVVATGLEVPEGPALLGDGRLVFVEQILGRVSMFDGGAVTPVSQGPGAPNAVVVGSDGNLYAAQNGGVVGPWRAAQRCAPAIERIRLDGRIETLTTEIQGARLQAPNDLVFGADGRLYLTDPAEPYDPENRSAVNRLFALNSDGGDVLLELDPRYTNGIAFMADGRLCWVESYERHVCVLEGGERRVLCQLPEWHLPDGLDVAQDGRLFITTVASHGITVVSPDGELLDHLFLDEQAVPTNCCFDGSALWVTDFGADWFEQRGQGRLWRVETDAVGIPAWHGAV